MLGRIVNMSMAALLAASVSAAAAGCAVHQECGSCLDATDDDNDSCFWCYSTRSCQAVNPSIAALLEGKTFNGCADYSLDAATCACRPTVYTSCADCAGRTPQLRVDGQRYHGHYNWA